MNNKHIDRRQFLQNSLLLSATSLLPISSLAKSRQVSRIGLQLFTLRQEMFADFAGTLASVAELGYQEIEFAGYFSRSASEVRHLLEANGLNSPAAHIPLNRVQSNLQAEIDFAAELGQKFIVVPIVPPEERSADDYRRHAETLNRAGEAMHQAGIRIAYHNHSFEFDDSNDQYPFDILLNETDPELVDFELDLYWIVKAGVDPIPYFEKYPGRFSLLHVKDMNDRGQITEVGSGIIDFPALFSYEETAGFQHYFVEHDNPEDGLTSVASSIGGLRSFRF
ncbi:MAG: sugar phosphate isomerase/epimerase [Gammaproteobacteria bacterium]|nr:sugar phosphate isomerase/epimerase [Gammaproteobacteria bacterium]